LIKFDFKAAGFKKLLAEGLHHPGERVLENPDPAGAVLGALIPTPLYE
jgi:hypothetical protein